MTDNNKLILNDGYEVAYIKLPKHPQKITRGCIKKTLRLLDFIPNYKGDDVYLDFDADGILIGIEILE